MKKLFKALLLLSVLVFAINCQQQTTKSDFEVVEVDKDLTPDTPVPTPGDDEKGVQPLSTTELDVVLPNLNPDVNTLGTTTVAIGFNIPETGGRITAKEFRTKGDTELTPKLMLVSHAGGYQGLLEKGVKIIEETSTNGISVQFNGDLKAGLPLKGAKATYKVTLYIKDTRKLEDTEKKYALTTREFEFTVTR